MKRDSSTQPGRMQALKIVAALIALMVVPAAITLHTVKHPARLSFDSDNPTPLGYTWSLLLFLVPILAVVVWLQRHPQLQSQRRAFWRTLALLVPLGFALDFLFGTQFFVFPNQKAVLGILIPALGGKIPLEEFVFYLAGFMAVLLIYLWADQYWLRAYHVDPDREGFAALNRLVQFDPASVLWGLGLLAAAAVYKKVLSSTPQGFPWYFAYLLAAAVIPSAGFIRSIQRFVNWRAFWFAFGWILLTSLLWEATLASPYGWWRYQDAAMIGIFIQAWQKLPVEAVLVWLAVTFTTVILFEVINVFLATGKSWREALFGIKPREKEPQRSDP
jgi:Lycopene cyclase